MLTASLVTGDYLVFGVMISASLSIGIYYAVTSSKRQTTTEYLMAGHNMALLPVTLSLIASYQSSIMMLGAPAEGYAYGIPFILGEFGSATGTILEVFVGLSFIERLELKSPYEYFERRFKSRCLRLLANIFACLSHLTYMSVVLYGQAITLQAVTGFSVYGSISITTTAAVIYTAAGGLKAVIWTDVLQFLIMFSGLLAVTIKGTIEAGGTADVWNRAVESHRLDLSLDPDPTVRYTLWNLYFGRIVTGFGMLISPATMQRISSSRTPKQARRALLLTAVCMPLLTLIAVIEGIVAYAYYSYLRCDPIESKQVETPNQIVPLLVMDLFKQLPGMPGLFLSALFSASLSTVSSLLSAMASITWFDVTKTCKPNMSDFRGLLITKATVVVYGALAGVLAVTVSQIRTKTLLQIILTIDAVLYFPVNAIFYLGALVPSANFKGAITGLVSGVLFISWLVIGSMISPSGEEPYLPLAPIDQCPVYNISVSLVNINTSISNRNMTSPATTYTEQHDRSGVEVLYNLSYTLLSVLGVLVVFVVGTVVSWVTGGWRNRADPELVIHVTDIQCWCLRGRRRGNDNSNDYSLTPVGTGPDIDDSRPVTGMD